MHSSDRGLMRPYVRTKYIHVRVVDAFFCADWVILSHLTPWYPSPSLTPTSFLDFPDKPCKERGAETVHPDQRSNHTHHHHQQQQSISSKQKIRRVECTYVLLRIIIKRYLPSYDTYRRRREYNIMLLYHMRRAARAHLLLLPSSFHDDKSARPCVRAAYRACHGQVSQRAQSIIKYV